ncbi:hypothetical protein GCM10007096_24290 [Pullulanibacillus pueri]|uniref:Tetratricopeptide repeat protein n=2 Tax=Pullulanibacillus pueri TaxID=1437324 RepID=A0A8J2ZWS5_9BACL|nr:hypothetical protein GCM10007096_24290 [Pullulanibacillus pueri]
MTSKDQNHNNVVQFPRLSERLLEKAITTLKSKNYKEALDLFKQLEHLEPNHPQASYGLAVCYVELGLYEEARGLTKAMLHKAIGNYYDVLKLHITVLIQMREYNEVLNIIDAVLAENDVPTEIRQILLQLAHFAEQRRDETHDDPQLVDELSKDLGLQREISPTDEVPRHIVQEIEEGLRSGNHERQWSAINLAQRYKAALPSLIKYLEEEGDPILKSLVLQGLKEGGFQDKVNVVKFNTTYTVDLSQPLFYNGFSDSINRMLEDILSSNNPTLEEVASQIWNHFVLLVYPRPLEPLDAKLWAAACYLYSLHISGIEDDSETIELLFDTPIENVYPLVEVIRSFEENT